MLKCVICGTKAYYYRDDEKWNSRRVKIVTRNYYCPKHTPPRKVYRINPVDGKQVQL